MLTAGLIVFGYLTLVLAASNDFIQEQNSLKDGRQKLALVGCTLGLAAHLPLTVFASYGCLSWRAFLLFIPSHDRVPSVSPLNQAPAHLAAKLGTYTTL